MGTGRSAMTGVRRVVHAGLVPIGALAALLAATPWMRAFPPGTFLPIALAAVVLASAIPGIVAGILRRSLWWSASVSLVGLVVVVQVPVLRDPFALGLLLRGVGEGPARLLSTTLPITTMRWVLIVPVAVVWVTAAVLAELLVRTSSRGGLLAVAFGSFTLAFAMTAGGEGAMLGSAVGLFVVIGSLVALRTWTSRPVIAGDDDSGVERFEARPVRNGAVVLAIAAVVLYVVVPNLGPLTDPPVVPERTPGAQSATVITPVATFAQLRRGDLGIAPSTVLFRVTADRGMQGYLSAAHLDDYDGDAWRVARTFEPTGGRIPSDPIEGRGLLVTQRYEVVDLGRVPGGWMAYGERPIEVAGIEVRYDPGSSMVLSGEPLDRGVTYTVRSTVGERSSNEVANDPMAVVGASQSGDDDQVPRELHEALASWVQRLEDQTGTPSAGTLGFLAAVQDVLRTRYARLDERDGEPRRTGADDPSSSGSSGTKAPQYVAAGGTTFADVAAAIGTHQAGTPEQFATLFALVARHLGLPARLVTGFRVGDGTQAMSASESRDVRAADAWTWVEVPVVGEGWIVFDPTPAATARPQVERGSGIDATTTTVAPRSQSEAVAARQGAAIAPPGDLTIPDEGASRGWWWAVPLVVAIGLLAGPALAGAQRRWYRRRRRKGEPSQRVVGAWHDTLESLDRAGVTHLDGSTNTEVVEAAARLDERARGPVTTVAATANVALFSPGGVEASEADAAWAAAGAARSVILGTGGWRRRLRSWWTLSRRPQRDRASPPR